MISISSVKTCDSVSHIQNKILIAFFQTKKTVSYKKEL